MSQESAARRLFVLSGGLAAIGIAALSLTIAAPDPEPKVVVETVTVTVTVNVPTTHPRRWPGVFCQVRCVPATSTTVADNTDTSTSEVAASQTTTPASNSQDDGK